MGTGWIRNEWLRQIAVAAAYVIVYEASHPFSTNAQFALGSGLRLIWLLFLPYRYLQVAAENGLPHLLQTLSDVVRRYESGLDESEQAHH